MATCRRAGCSVPLLEPSDATRQLRSAIQRARATVARHGLQSPDAPLALADLEVGRLTAHLNGYCSLGHEMQHLAAARPAA